MVGEGVAIIADSCCGGFDFAKGVYNYLKERLTNVILVDIEKTVFRDGEFKIKIKDNIRRRKCFFIHDSTKSATDWLAELIFTLEALSFSSPEEINVVLPYTRFARQDRKDESRVSVNIKAVADIISLYADRGLTVDLHCPNIQEYFRIPFDNLYSFPVLISYLKSNYREMLSDLVIVSPDLGGGKRAEAFVKRLAKQGIEAGVALGHKPREKANVVKEVKIIGEVEGKNCLILDDIIDTGGTIIKTAEVLKQKGAKSVSAYASHGLFSDGIEKFNVFEKVFVSDTLMGDFGGRIEVISLIDLFGEAIFRTVAGKSLSVLFD